MVESQCAALKFGFGAIDDPKPLGPGIAADKGSQIIGNATLVLPSATVRENVDPTVYPHEWRS